MRAINFFTTLLSIALIVVASEGNAQRKEWDTFRGNIQHTGYYEGNSPDELTEPLWKFKTGNGVGSSPAVWSSLEAKICTYMQLNK